jgi:hypothetical protein
MAYIDRTVFYQILQCIGGSSAYISISAYLNTIRIGVISEFYMCYAMVT